MRVAAAQVALDLDNSVGTRKRIEAAVREAATAGAELVVLPELASCGTQLHDRSESWARAEPLDGPYVGWLRELTAALGIVVVSGFAERRGGDASRSVANTAVLVDAGELAGVYRKVHLWGDEPDFFVAAAEPPLVVSCRAGRVGLMVCYDLEFPEWVRLAADAGAEVIAVPANWPLYPDSSLPGGRPLEVLKAQASAGIYRVHVVICDRAGSERGQDWLGGSVIIDCAGEVLAGPASDRGLPAMPDLLTADLDLARARDKRIGPRNDARADRRPELYGLARG